MVINLLCLQFRSLKVITLSSKMSVLVVDVAQSTKAEGRKFESL